MDNVQVPDTSDIHITFDVYRIENAVMTLDTQRMEASILELQSLHPSFMEIYLRNIMGFTDEEDPEVLINNLEGFIKTKNIKDLYGEVWSQYEDFSDLKQEFESAFKLYKYYFPERDIPDIYTFISEYGYQRLVFLDEEENDALGIGLDLFLGTNYPYRDYMPDNPAFSAYLVRSYNKDHLVKRSMEALVEDIIGDNRGKNLLEKMIHNGKKLYILDQLLPHASDTIIMEYTPAQLQWCEDNELEMWAFFLKEDLFYSADINRVNKLVNPSPSAPGMPPEAPGRTGNYMGWKIVEAFMEKNSGYSLMDLVLMEDAQKILNISKFKPRK